MLLHSLINRQPPLVPPFVEDLKVLLLPKLLLEAIEPLPLLLVLYGDPGGRTAPPTKSLLLMLFVIDGCRLVATVTYSTFDKDSSLFGVPGASVAREKERESNAIIPINVSSVAAKSKLTTATVC